MSTRPSGKPTRRFGPIGPPSCANRRSAQRIARSARVLAPLVALSILGSVTPARAQHVELTGFGGIQFGGATDLLLGSASFAAGPSYGGMAYYRVRDDGLFGVSYSREQSQMSATWIGNGQILQGTVPVDVGIIHAGGELEISPKKKLTPILGLSVGATHITPRNGGETGWYFSAALTGGAKYRITDHFGLRAHMRLIATVINDNSTVACVSSGGLTCAVASELDGLVQGDLVGGVFFAF